MRTVKVDLPYRPLAMLDMASAAAQAECRRRRRAKLVENIKGLVSWAIIAVLMGWVMYVAGGARA